VRLTQSGHGSAEYLELRIGNLWLRVAVGSHMRYLMPHVAPLARCERLMTVQDEHLEMLVQAAATTERHHFALGVANALRYANSVEGPSARELGEAEEALVAWKVADRALAAYQASERWAPTRD
jgi:hypothetical protein